MQFLNFGINKMLSKIKDLLTEIASADKGEKKNKPIVMDEETMQEIMEALAAQQAEPDMRTIGLFTDVAEEKIAERIDSNLLNVNIQEVADLPKSMFETKVQNLAKKLDKYHHPV